MDELDSIEYRPPSATGEVGPDGGGASISWRTGHLSDWTLILGERRFSTHRAILARASEVLAASMHASYGSTSTDLTGLLPPVTHCVFEYVLEEIYEGSCEVDDTQLVLLFAVADILGMKGLFDRALARIKERIKLRAISFLQDVRQLPPSEHLRRVAAAARSCVARDFSRHCKPEFGSLSQLPQEDVAAVLASEDLAAREDEVFDFLLSYAGEGTQGSCNACSAQEADLWRHCRLAFVSQDRLLKLRARVSAEGACQGTVRVLMDALSYRTTLDRSVLDRDLKEALESSYPRAWLEPRRPRHIDPPRENELDFIVHIPREPDKVYPKGHCIRSAQKEMEGGVLASILVFPNGAVGHRGSPSLLVPIFVEVVPKVLNAENHTDWGFRRHYFISIWPWEPGPSAAIRNLRDGVDELREEKNPDVNPAEISERTGAVRWVDKHHFKPALPDRGWYEFPHDRVRACCDPNGFLWLRARVWSSPGGGRW